VVPIGIEFFDQSDLPGSIPLLQPFLATDCIFNVVELLEIDQLVDAISLREAFHQFEAMLGDATDQIICHAYVERAADAAGEDVDVEAGLPSAASGILDRPVKPGDDEFNMRL